MVWTRMPGGMGGETGEGLSILILELGEWRIPGFGVL